MEFPFMMKDDAASLRDALQALFGSELVIDRELGRGGMAAVFLAFDPGLQRRVAVKVLLPELNQHRVGDRFLREARMMASLRHPNIVTVHAVRSSHETHAFVMQFVDGVNLETRIAEGPLPLGDAGRILSQVAAALQYAHEQGVIHRDVKPANVLLDGHDNAVVSDFGIARSREFEGLTSTGIVVGSWDYMSPEQRSGDTVTAATDQYAFGVLAFEVLTGRLPFRGPALEVMRAHMHDEPPAVRGLRRDVPAAIDVLLQRMMAKDPDARFPDFHSASHTFAELARRFSPGGSLGSHTTNAAGRAGTGRRQAAVGVSAIAVVALAAWTFGKTWDRGPADWLAAEPANVVVPDSMPSAALRPAGSSGVPTQSAEKSLQPPALTALSEPTKIPAPESLKVITDTSSSHKSIISGHSSVSEPSGTKPPSEIPRSATDPSTPTAATSSVPVATITDARRLAREFVTLVNQRRTRDLSRLLTSALPPDDSRSELLRLVESAPDLAAGFDRLASAPAQTDNRFETEFDLDLQWRGGARVLRITLTAAHAASGWSVANVTARPP